MLKTKKLPNEYWEQGVACLVFILNKSPTKSEKEKINLKAWIIMHTSVSHLRVFGCVAHAHIPKELRNKLDDRSEKCIFVGYNE